HLQSWLRRAGVREALTMLPLHRADTAVRSGARTREDVNTSANHARTVTTCCRLDPRLWNRKSLAPSPTPAEFAVAVAVRFASAQARQYRPTAATPEPCGIE